MVSKAVVCRYPSVNGSIISVAEISAYQLNSHTSKIAPSAESAVSGEIGVAEKVAQDEAAGHWTGSEWGMSSPMSEAETGEPFISVDGLVITQYQFYYALIIIFITALLLVTSVLTIAVIVTNEHLRDVTGYYLISLAVSDLLTGTLITPLAIYAALDPSWKFGTTFMDDNQKEHLGPGWLCKTEAYIGVLIWSSILYTFMWIGVDRYAALFKPSRYDVEQTFTRCKCWITFSWVTSILLSCPILAAQMEARYYPDAFICILDWGATKAYSATLAALVILPSFISICYSYHYIFSSLRDPSDLEDSQKMVLETDQTYMMSFFMILAFGLSWAPWFGLRAYETLFQDEVPVKPLHFSLMWLAVAAGCWKLLIYVIMNREFRRGLVDTLGLLCCGCCRRRSQSSRERSDYEVINAQQNQL